jgi:hypothetical protein
MAFCPAKVAAEKMGDHPGRKLGEYAGLPENARLFGYVASSVSPHDESGVVDVQLPGW